METISNKTSGSEGQHIWKTEEKKIKVQSESSTYWSNCFKWCLFGKVWSLSWHFPLTANHFPPHCDPLMGIKSWPPFCQGFLVLLHSQQTIHIYWESNPVPFGEWLSTLAQTQYCPHSLSFLSLKKSVLYLTFSHKWDVGGKGKQVIVVTAIFQSGNWVNTSPFSVDDVFGMGLNYCNAAGFN